MNWSTSHYAVKLCRRCGLFFPLDDFFEVDDREDGRSDYCIGCMSFVRKSALNVTNGEIRAQKDDWKKKASERNTERRVPRLCKVCEQPTRSPQSPYCERHALEALDRRIRRGRYRKNMTPAQLERVRARERARGTRIYATSEHRNTRKSWIPLVATGSVPCARCGELIRTDEKWHLGHVDGTNQYAGPEHVRCNCATATPGRVTAPKPLKRDPVTHRFLPRD